MRRFGDSTMDPKARMQFQAIRYATFPTIPKIVFQHADAARCNPLLTSFHSRPNDTIGDPLSCELFVEHPQLREEDIIVHISAL